MGHEFIIALSSLLFISIQINRVSSLMCYVCSTKVEGQEDCLEIPPGSVKYLQNCTAPRDQSCRSILQWVDYEAVRQERDRNMVRQCATYAHDPDKPCYYRTGNGGRISVCTCEGEVCNEAPNVAISLITTLLLLVIHLVMNL